MKLNKVPTEKFTMEPHYDILDGGYFEGKDFSDDPETIKRIDEAINIINSCVNILEENELIG